MKNYIIGDITFSDAYFIEIECNNVGYKYNIVCKIPNNVKKVYLHEIKNEYECKTYAFSCEFDRNTFISLLSIKGIGVATIRNLYSRYDTNQICVIIKNKDINKLLLIDGIGQITAQNIIGNIETNKDIYIEKEIVAALKVFGYTTESITMAKKYIDYNLSVSENIEYIIKKL